MRVGQGFDVHALAPGRALVLGGIEIPAVETGGRGLAGHSDGDVLLHAIASALLGALGEGDLGQHFPSTDTSLAGIASGSLLARVWAMASAAGFELCNVDATVIAQVPRLAPYQAKMRANVAALLEVGPERVNVKVTSTDRLGTIGRGEGIAAMAVVLLRALAK